MLIVPSTVAAEKTTAEVLPCHRVVTGHMRKHVEGDTEIHTLCYQISSVPLTV